MSEKSETVTLSRAEYEALIERLVDAEDLAAVAAAEAREAALGKEKARADYLPIELVRRLSAGEHPVRVWRAHRGLSREALAAAAGVAPSYLTEIETRRNPAASPRSPRLPRLCASRSTISQRGSGRSTSEEHLIRPPRLRRLIAVRCSGLPADEDRFGRSALRLSPPMVAPIVPADQAHNQGPRNIAFL